MENRISPSGALWLVNGLMSWLDLIRWMRTHEKGTCSKPRGHHVSLPKGPTSSRRSVKLLWAGRRSRTRDLARTSSTIYHYTCALVLNSVWSPYVFKVLNVGGQGEERASPRANPLPCDHCYITPS